jgi:iron complex transport system ATP-binding protein
MNGIKGYNLTVKTNETFLLKDLTIEIEKNNFISIVGPNGAGKTTLMKTLAGFIKPMSGDVCYGDISISKLTEAQLANLRSIVFQTAGSHSGLRVRDVLESAVIRNLKWWQFNTAKFDSQINTAIEATGIQDYIERKFDSLSGGERQKVLIARALAQETPIIFLDEPTNHLDPSSRFEVMDILSNLKKTRVVVMHDLELALEYSDRVIVLNSGALEIQGRPEEVFVSDTFRSIFKLQTAIVPNPFKPDTFSILKGKK